MKGPALFHFSETDAIARFVPRPVAMSSKRAPGMDWLNGPLVWAIDDWHQPLHHFPRDCPRILAWPTQATTQHQRAQHWFNNDLRMIAWVEIAWLVTIERATIYRYAMPDSSFAPLGDSGMWVSREAVTPTHVEALSDLPDPLAGLDVVLRAVTRLPRLEALKATGLHVSAIRLRNAGKAP